MERLYTTLALCILAGVLRGAFIPIPEVTYDINSCPDNCQCRLDQLECANLKQTWLSFLKVLPPSTKSLTIRESQLDNLALSDVEHVAPFKDMTYLRITRCNLTVVGAKAFQPFPDLRELHLDGDSIKELNVDALHSLSSLKLLSLKQNVITKLHENTFQATCGLQLLDLSYNHIDVLYPTVFHSTDQLQSLNLTQNKLSYLHPATFTKLTELQTLRLANNQLQVVHQDTFRNLTSLTHVTMDDNPWSCNCGLEWLHSENTQTHPLLRSLKTGLRCHTPPELKSRFFHELSNHNFTCTSPQIVQEHNDVLFLRLSTKVLYCNASGYPPPSVYWITPRGVLAVPNNRQWMSPAIVQYKQSHEYIGVPTFHKSKLIALEDGSLMIKQIRHYFSGRYTCVAENPAGVSTTSFNVSIVSVVQNYAHFSMIIGGMTASVFVVLSIIILSIRQSVYCTMKRYYKKPPTTEIETTDEGSPVMSSRSSPSQGRWTPDYWERDYMSPYESPMKCTTPIEPTTEDEHTEGGVKIRQTLEDAGFRLRTGMERSVTKIRSGAHHVTESGRHYMHTIRESGSSTIHNIRSSGSHISNRMRAGVVLGVEQVKYHVQSMRELCLTGNIGQTISTVSVATDLDSNAKTDVVKKITYV